MKPRTDLTEPEQVTAARTHVFSAVELISHLKNQRHWNCEPNPNGLAGAEESLRRALDQLAIWS